MSSLKESRIIGQPNEISYESIVKIKEQMEKNIGKILIVTAQKSEQGTVFFCKIPFPDKNNMLPVLITNNHLIDEKILSNDNKKITISIKEKKDDIILSLKNRITYTNESYDITIIEIKKEEEDIIDNYLELDDLIIEDIINNSNQTSKYAQETIYIIQYPIGKLSVSYGIINSISENQKYNFCHKCSTDKGSSGSPILNENNKVIGVHKEGNSGSVNFNAGTFLNYPIKDFIQKKYKCDNNIRNRNTEINNIKKPNEYPKEITFKCTKKILEQMEKDICRILIGQKQATGFFCKIPFPDRDNKLSVLITTDIIKNDIIKIGKTIPIFFREKNNGNKQLEINLDNKIFNTFEDFGITIIEIKREDNIGHFLELDDSIVDEIIKIDNNQNNHNAKYKNNTIYITHYSEENISVSYGIINEIFEENKFYFQHKCVTDKGSSGSPIFNLDNKVIGIHKEYDNYYNKGIFLASPIKEFIKQNEDYIKQNNINNNEIQKDLFKEFKSNYKINIKNTKEKTLDFTANRISLRDNGLNDLCQIQFNQMTKLLLFSNRITSIIPLGDAKFDKLEVLSLGRNNISDISVLEKVNFKNLTNLNLGNNKISDISVLEKVKFKDLKELLLNENQISDISVLDKVNFQNLKELKFDHNKISNEDVFENTNFPKLKKLNLSFNKISNIDSLGKAEFKKGLEELYLNDNQIEDIKPLQKFINLKILRVKKNNKIDMQENEQTDKFFKEKKKRNEMEYN